MLSSLVVLLLLSTGAAFPQSRTYGSRTVARSRGTVSRSRSVGTHTRSAGSKCSSCDRDDAGKIKRDPAARRKFQQQHPCPATGKTTGTCPGYVVDHIVALKKGGEDKPENMQWQTVEEAKSKDRIE